jgi:hypothetical protein
MRRLLLIGLLLLLPLFLPSCALGATTPYKLLVWGDGRPWTTSGTAVSTGFKVVSGSMRAQNADHAIADGDYVYLGANDSVATINAKYDAFFATYDKVGVKTDYAMGNHEAVGPNGRTVYYDRIHAQPGYYTVNDGPFDVIVLNTNVPGLDKRIGFYGVGDSRNSVQADWLVRQLTAITNKRAWIIVALHHPLLDPETDDPFATTAIAERNALVKLFHAYGVDLVVQGDSHFYRRHHRTDGSSYVTEGMAGAPPVAASTTPIDGHDVTTLGSTGSSPLYGYVTVKRDKTGTITGRMFWMQSSDGWTRHIGDKWTLKQVVRTAP